MNRVVYLGCFFSFLLSVAVAQAGPNTLARYNPANRTMSVNATFCLIPVDKAIAEALTGHRVLSVPSTILPSFPEGKHPLVLQSSYLNDIRMTVLNTIPLQIPSLTQASLVVPYTDVNADGKTPINVPLDYYIGGTNGQDVAALVPSIASGVSPFEGTTIFPARIVPDTAAASALSGGLYSFQVKPYLLPNTISGPGVYAEAFDAIYKLSSSPYTEHTFHTLLNSPQLLNTGKCQRNTIYFNETFANPHMAIANITLYHQILSTPPAAVEGVYNNVYCYQANGEQVSATGEDCNTAAALVDPKALQ